MRLGKKIITGWTPGKNRYFSGYMAKIVLSSMAVNALERTKIRFKNKNRDKGLLLQLKKGIQVKLIDIS